MRAEVKAGILRPAIAEAAKYAGKRSPQVVVQKLLVGADAGGLYVRGTNLTQHFEARVATAESRPVPGRTLYDPDRMLALLASLDAEDVVLLSEENGRSIAEYGNLGMQSVGFRIEFNSEDPDLFPEFPVPPADAIPPFTVSGRLFAFAARRAGGVVDTKVDGKYGLTGCLASFTPSNSLDKPGQFRLAGADGRRIAFVAVDAEGSTELPDARGLLIHGADCLRAADVFQDEDAVRVQFDLTERCRVASHVWLTSPKRRYVARLAEGRFPAVREADMRKPLAAKLAAKAIDVRLAAQQVAIAVTEDEKVEATKSVALSAEGKAATFTANYRRRDESVVGFELAEDVGADFGPYWVLPRVVEEAVRHVAADDVVRIGLPKEETAQIHVSGDGWNLWFAQVAAPTDLPPEGPSLFKPAARKAKARAGR